MGGRDVSFEGPVVKTPSGGIQAWHRNESGFLFMKMPWGEVRTGNKGYCILPGSPWEANYVKNGRTIFAPYEWEVGCTPLDQWEGPLPALDPGLEEALRARLRKTHDEDGASQSLQGNDVEAHGSAASLKDDDLLRRATKARNGDKFRRLYEGDISASPSHSEADLSLCSYLAFWTGGNAEQIDRLFRRCKLYRPKWNDVHHGNGKTYGEMTIERAIAQTTQHYTPGRREGQEDESDGAEEAKRSSLGSTDGFFGGANGRTFIPLRAARALRSGRTFMFGFDPDRDRGKLMEYRNGVWRSAVGLDVDVQRLLGDDVRRNRVDETRAALSRDVPRLPWRDWNPTRRLINCLSGMLDPVTLRLGPHRPEYRSTFQIPHHWNPDARSSGMASFFTTVVSSDSWALMGMSLGYLLVPDISADKYFVLEGPENAGKTTFLGVVKDLIGNENTAVVSLHDLGENRFALAQLENKLLGIFDDLDNRALKSASILKVLTGGMDTIRVEHKGQDAYSAPFYATLFFTANEVPNTPEKTGAWYRRICIIPFNTIPKGRRDPELPAKLATRESMEWLFVKAVTGLRSLIANRMHFPVSQSSMLALAKYKNRNDSVAEFITECCARGPGYRVQRDGWYAAYREYAERCGYHPYGKRRAYANLREMGFDTDKKDADGNRSIDGLGIIN